MGRTYRHRYDRGKVEHLWCARCGWQGRTMEVPEYRCPWCKSSDLNIHGTLTSYFGPGARRWTVTGGKRA